MSKSQLSIVERPVRKLILNGCGKHIRNWLLSSNQLSTLKSITKEITANELSKYLNISIQNASQKLKILNRKGYLTARQVSCQTGGYIFIYKRVKQ